MFNHQSNIKIRLIMQNKLSKSWYKMQSKVQSLTDNQSVSRIVKTSTHPMISFRKMHKIFPHYKRSRNLIMKFYQFIKHKTKLNRLINLKWWDVRAANHQADSNHLFHIKDCKLLVFQEVLHSRQMLLRELISFLVITKN